MLRYGLRLALFLLICRPAVGESTPVVNPDLSARLVREIRNTSLQPERAVSLQNVEIEMGHARFQIDRGVLIPATTASGRDVELVFLGQAHVRIVPPDEIEAAQLEMFTGRRSLDATIDRAVVVIGNRAIVDTLLDRPPAELHPERLEQAQAMHEEWLLKTERRNTGVESSIFRVLADDVVYRDYFAFWCSSQEVGDFVYQLDPEEEEQITLAAFTPIDVHGWDRLRLQRHIRIQQRKGRWLGIRVQDLGAWDVWLSSRWEPTEVPDIPGNAGFETTHYEVDLQIMHDRMRFEGQAKLSLESQLSGRSTLTLDLFRDLEVTRVVDGQGRELHAFRSGEDVVVRLAEPSVAGAKMVLDITYSGRILAWVGRKTFDLTSTSSWHPHVGTVDRATYDVKLTWPRKFDLIASGKLVDEGESKRYRWQRRTLDQPSTAFSFVIGHFDVRRDTVGDVALTTAFPEVTPSRLTPEMRAQTVDSIRNSLEFFQERFGPYPLDSLTVVMLPRNFSQSFLGYITLTDSILLSGETVTANKDFVRETLIAHEVAHQWWGNLVGWWSYRDQWLSEAMANYASLVYYADQSDAGPTFLADMSSGWRDMLGQRTREGRTIESIGPVVLGGRLNSSLSTSAYQAIVYRKGAVVLAMLARAVGEEAFQEMLRSLVEHASHRVLTTEAFVDSIERMSGLDLEGFAQRFIYGTGIPNVYYDYESAKNDDGEWKLSGQVRLLAEPRYSFRVVGRGDGWELERRPLLPPSTTAMMVPYRVTLEGEGDVRTRTGGLARADWGRLMIEGAQQGFEVAIADRPLELELDPRGEVLARFYALDRYPKRGRRFQAADLALEGRLDEAESLYLGALEVSATVAPAGVESGWGRQADQGLVEDSRIRLSLARLYLRQGKLEASRGMLDRVEEDLVGDRQMFRMERDVLWARLEMAEGQTTEAFRRLRKTMRLAAPRGGPRNWQAMLWQVQLNSERLAVTEGFALLAIAARELGETADFEWARDLASGRGADLSAFQRK